LSENSKLGDVSWAIDKVMERAVHPDHFQKLPCSDFQLNLPDTDERGDELFSAFSCIRHTSLRRHAKHIPAPGGRNVLDASLNRIVKGCLR
jgi:hypothetical protein